MKISSYDLVELENLKSVYWGIKILDKGLKDVNSISDFESIYIGSCEGEFSITLENLGMVNSLDDDETEKNINFPEYSNFLDDINKIHSTWKYDRRGFQCWPSKGDIRGYILDIGDSSAGVTAEFSLSEAGILTVKNDSYLKPFEMDKNGISTIQFTLLLLTSLAQAGNQLNVDMIENMLSKQQRTTKLGEKIDITGADQRKKLLDI